MLPARISRHRDFARKALYTTHKASFGPCIRISDLPRPNHRPPVIRSWPASLANALAIKNTTPNNYFGIHQKTAPIGPNNTAILGYIRLSKH